MASLDKAAKGKEFALSPDAEPEQAVFTNYIKKTMRNIFLLILLLALGPVPTQAQQAFQDSIALERTQLHKNNMLVLGAWAAANIIQGTISAGNAKGSDHFFHQMNAYWNTVNLALAGLGYLKATRDARRQYTMAANLTEQHKTEKFLLLNTGLDAAYIMTGLYLKEKNTPQATGYGNSLLLQGGFLLVFDIIQYAEHRRNGKLLENNMGNWQLGSTMNGLGLVYRFP
ncbi:MAG: hypothetical protein JWQ78_753 [Sediminibacterium sp.]|nr:hypothetical protein [Sediminibacterium sp.]